MRGKILMFEIETDASEEKKSIHGWLVPPIYVKV